MRLFFLKGQMKIVVVGDPSTPHDAIRSLLETTLTHVAEFHTLMLEIISEKYGISMQSLVETIEENTRFQAHIQEHPANEVMGKALLKTKKGKKVRLLPSREAGNSKLIQL